MEIPIVDIVKVYRELDTASAPLLCLCKDAAGNFANYYVKFVLDEDEYCGLVYEVVCSQLASHFNVTTPQIAFARTGDIVEHNGKIIRNKLLTPESICFASKEVENHRMMNDTDEIKDKAAFNKLLNVDQFFRIALFDLWVAHDDRAGINYNLLTKLAPAGYYFYSIDHYHCFGGNANFNKDFSGLDVRQYKSILTSSLGISIRRHLQNREIFDTIVADFDAIDPEEIRKIVENVFRQLPKEWNINPDLQTIISKLLTNTDRNKKVVEIFNYLITT